ncbi:unnamed protein product [Pocillopora meandrina]|uniref:Uncharacterized protein n=1 Tax=Pocillopora meandrina TaxID=46732 RepID=A0AAU9X7S8_9CNID|nr:unnamed protein product [Pocillopora meandrina]
MGVPSLAIPTEAPNPRHTILMPVQGKSMNLISLQLISNQKYMPKLSTTPHKIQEARPWGGRRSKTISPTAKQPYSLMKTLTSNLWVKGKPLHLFSSDYAKLTLVKIPADEVH